MRWWDVTGQAGWNDWAAGNGITGEPAVTRLPGADGDPPVGRLTWSAPDCPPVVLYRIEVIGRVPRHLDASEILLDMVTAG
jgi:hypothetical protein